jgi:hypothetical protein
MMAYDQHSECFLIYDSEQDPVWKPTHKAATNIVLDNHEMKRIGTNSLNRRVDFGAKFFS